jgi:hypothetical protein
MVMMLLQLATINWREAMLPITNYPAAPEWRTVGICYVSKVFLKFITDGRAIATNGNVALAKSLKGQCLWSSVLALATLDLGFYFGIEISYHEAH